MSIAPAAIDGTVTKTFEAVRDAFAANFQRAGEDAELGAALCVYVDGNCVVNLWGGFADAARSRTWEETTLANIWSGSKGIVAIAVAMLVDRGRLRYEDRVAQHWPEFAQAGKADVTVAQILSHQSGLNGFAQPTTLLDFYDWDLVTSRLAAQATFWPTGTQASYHAMTYGFLAGELIRRVSGQDVGAFVRDEIARPLQADIFIGLPEAFEPRVAEMVPAQAPALTSGPQPAEIPGRALTNPRLDPLAPNTRAWRAAQIPAANGQASGRGIGRVYGAIAAGGALAGVRIISPEGIDRLRHVLHRGPDLLLGERYWAAGVSLNVAPAYGPHAETFGHTGWGGSFGCADRQRRVGIGYVMNRMGGQLIGNPRGTSLATAIFTAVDAAG
jgi:CubicO group peptidase (beta-lactamase class C family)